MLIVILLPHSEDITFTLGLMPYLEAYAFKYTTANLQLVGSSR